jgi:DNA repair protein SbcC/Rad50
MRLHLLQMAAFGPYARPQRIDFDLLASSGLFLLEGPTGAGKSTILDAITFALYGGLAGEEAAEDRLRSHFAGPAAEPSVTLEFSLGGTRYRVTRSPEYRRPKKRGEGFTTEASRVHLERLAAVGSSSLSSNKAEVAEAITEAVGLNREQFTQVMLLPQGEFARFLRARDDDRRELLTKLFGTQLYDRVTAELDRRRGLAARELDLADRAVAGAVSAAAEAAGLDTDARTELGSLSRAERETRLKEAAEAIAESVAVTAAGLEVAASQLLVTRAEDEQARQQSARMARLTGAGAALRAHEQGRPEHEQRARRLAAARHAEPVRPLLAALADAESATTAARESLLGVTGSTGTDPAGGPGHPEAETRDGSGPAAGLLDGRGGPEAAARAEAAEREALALQHLADQEAGLPALEHDLVVLEQAAAQASLRAAALEEAQSELPARITRLAGELELARVAAAGLEALLGRLEAVTEQHSAAVQAADLGPQVEAARLALLAAVDDHQALVDVHQSLIETRLSGMATELATQIAEGDPCPVCGSTDHPAPACAPAQAVSANDIADAAARRDEAEAERTRLDHEHSALALQEAARAAQAGGRTAGDLAAEAEALTGDIAKAERAAADAAGLEADLASARDELEASAGDLRLAEKEAIAASQQAGAAHDRLAEMRADVAKAAGEFPAVAARQAGLRHAAARDRALAEVLDALAAAVAGEEKARQRAEVEAAGQGFASLAEAREAVIEPSRQAALAAEVDSWKAALAGLEAAVRAGDLAGLDPARAEEIQARAKAAAAALSRAQQAEQEVRRASDAARARAERLRDRMADVRAAEQSHDTLVEESGPVVRLAGLAKGVEGHRRVSLTTYVLRHWFSQVVAAANVRLSAMSSGRYELTRTDEGHTKRERTGLTLAVIDRYTSEERSPASLSGGETFYTSLALALGLADVVRAEAGGVDLDTLFIDEGFGSLDADTLDQVMGVIDDLRDRGRVVGIVSHVADLKDRVPERLEIRRLPDGSSTARVVA